MARQKFNFNSLNYIITDHIASSKGIIFFAILASLIGFCIGIVLVLGEKSYLGLLTSGDQNLLKYISGSASITGLMWQRLLSMLLCVLILFLCCLHYYSHFFAYCYITYQSALTTIMCGTVISYYGFSGIMNFIFLLLPANLVLLAFYILTFSVFARRARLQYKHKTGFISSFMQDDFFTKVLLLSLCFAAICIVFNLIIPLIIKAVYFIVY